MNAATIAIPTMLMSALSAATCGGGHAGRQTQGAAEAAGATGASAPPEPAPPDPAREGRSFKTLKWDGKAKSLEVRTMNAAVRAALSTDDQAHVART